MGAIDNNPEMVMTTKYELLNLHHTLGDTEARVKINLNEIPREGYLNFSEELSNQNGVRPFPLNQCNKSEQLIPSS